MPISEYYGGHGTEVMENMKKQYGSEKGERVFYATANKTGQTADEAELKRIVDAACDGLGTATGWSPKGAAGVHKEEAQDGWSETATETRLDVDERKARSGRFAAHASEDLSELRDLVLNA